MQQFDANDPKNLGRPLHFSMQTYAQAVIDMIRADEIETARFMLANVPSWYRLPGNYPQECQDILDTLNRNSYSIMDYSDDKDERGYTLQGVRDQIASGYCFPRLNIIDDFVAEQNLKMIFPWIYEVSPSHGPLPIALMDLKRSFNFYGHNMNHLATERFKEWLSPGVWQEAPNAGQPKVLVIYEVFEHCSKPEDAVQAAYKISPKWDHIFLSVPFCCLGNGLPNWHNRRLGHIRTYTPDEFAAFAMKSFPGFKWQMVNHVSIVLHGSKD